MSGFLGGQFGGTFPQESTSALAGGTTPATWHHESGEFGLGYGYDVADRHGRATWTDGVRSGVIEGAVTNLDELGWTVEDVFGRLLARPGETAASLEGGFAIACQDPSADRHLLVTDKLGARPIFHTETGPTRYASSVGVLVELLDDPSVDRQAVSDMLLMGHLWGDRTLVEGIRKQRPATVVEIVGDKRVHTRYWKPSYAEREPGRDYVTELVDRYRQAARRTSSTLPSRAGIWLSGGLDSRTTTSALLEHRQPDGFETLTAYTYDANPPTSDNPEIAGQVTDSLGIDLEEVPLSAATVGENFDRIIDATDGMVRWNTAANLAATYEIADPAPVLMEGMQGALLGDHLLRHHLTEYSSAVDAQLASEAGASPEQVTSLLADPIDPLATFETEARRSPESTTRETVLDVHFQNYYSRTALASNRLMRDRAGTRVVHADGDYLEWCATLPRRYRKGAIRGRAIPNGGVPCEPTRAKLALVRELNPDLANITYERTKVKPSWPHGAHVVGFVGNVLVNRLRSKPTYGNGELADFWIRNTDTVVHGKVTELVDDACSRPLFDADAVRTVYDEHMAGKNRAPMLGQITTLEHWLQSSLD